MDRNGYYGGESASLNLEQLYKKFRGDEKPPESLGRTRDYCVDLCPKFLMACGNLVKVLITTKVTRYLDFKSVFGSYVLKDSGLHKVPSTAKEALASSLMGMFQKRHYAKFLQFVSAYDEKESSTKTHDGFTVTDKTTVKELYDKFSLDENTQAFTGHAVALHLDDTYLSTSAKEFIERVKLYAFSVARYGNSPYIYPLYGLGGLPEGFSRLCAIHGGTYMLNKPVEEILYDEEGKVTGVKSEGKIAYCKQLIADPSYFIGTDKIKKTGQVARCIAIMSVPIPKTNSDSAQIILPAKQIKRKTDVYMTMISPHHKISAEGKYIAVISGTVEGKEAKDGKAEEVVRRELDSAIKLLGKTDQMFFWISDTYVAVNDPKKDQVYITSSYDATTHWESAADEVLKLCEDISGEKIDLSISADPTALSDPGADEAPAETEGETPAGESTEAAAEPAKDAPKEE